MQLKCIRDHNCVFDNARSDDKYVFQPSLGINILFAIFKFRLFFKHFALE